jgi:ankyrin repeat protein
MPNREDLNDQLKEAVANGEIHQIKALIKAGASIEESEALHYAAELGDIDILTLLLNSGGSIESEAISGETPLCYAAEFQRHDVMEFLIQRGANPNAQARGTKTTPLHHAASTNDATGVAILLSAGANVHAPNYAGFTPLALALRLHYADACRPQLEDKPPEAAKTILGRQTIRELASLCQAEWVNKFPYAKGVITREFNRRLRLAIKKNVTQAKNPLHNGDTNNISLSL